MHQGMLVFAQVMAHVPLTTFRRCVAVHRGDHKVQEFSCLDQFFAMAIAQLTARESLRDIEVNLRAQSARLYRMGFHCKSIARNTLAHANATRPWQIYADQVLRQIGKHCPRSRSIGIGQRVARNRLAAKSQAIKMLPSRAKIDLDVAQRLASSQLGEREREKLVEAGERLDLVLGAPPRNHARKRHQRQMLHDLCEDELACLHGNPWLLKAQKDGPKRTRNRHRPQNEIAIPTNKSYIYSASPIKRWDTSGFDKKTLALVRLISPFSSERPAKWRATFSGHTDSRRKIRNGSVMLPYIVVEIARHCARAGFPHCDCSLSHLRLTCIKFALPQTRIVEVLNIRTKPRMR